MRGKVRVIRLGEGKGQVIARKPDTVRRTADIEVWDKALKDGMYGMITDEAISVPTDGLLAVMRFTSPEAMELVGKLLTDAAEKWREKA